MRQWAGSNFELANRLRERKGLAALQKDASGNILWGQGNTTSPYAGAFSQQLPVDLATAFSPEMSQALRGVAANPVSVPPESLQRAWNQPSDLNGFTGSKIDFQYTPMTPAAPSQDYGRYFRSSPADLATSFSPQASQALQGVVQGQTPVPPESLQKAWNQPTPGLEAFSGAAQLPADYLRRFRLQGR